MANQKKSHECQTERIRENAQIRKWFKQRQKVQFTLENLAYMATWNDYIQHFPSYRAIRAADARLHHKAARLDREANRRGKMLKGFG